MAAQRRVQEVEEIDDGRTEALDALGVDLPVGGEHLLHRGAADTGVEQAAEDALVLRVLVDVGDVELGCPRLCCGNQREDAVRSLMS